MKWYGIVAFRETKESEESPGVWINEITKKYYYGDLTRNLSRRLENSSNLNDDISISNQLSIVADPFANEHFHNILYVEIASQKWKISEVEVVFPRLLLTIGKLYNGYEEE